MKNRLLLLLLLVLFYGSKVQAQKPGLLARYWNSLVSDTSDISRPQLLVYPTLGFSPETRWQFGLSALYVYYAARDTSNRLSSINPVVFYTLEKQYGLWVDHTLYSKKNRWFMQGRLRFQHFPLYYYGLGPNTPSEHPARVDATQILLRERLLRKIKPNFYAGLHTDFQRHSALTFQAEENQPLEKPTGATGSTNLGVGLGVMLDTRNNVLNARNGVFSELAFLRYDGAWRSDFNYTHLIADARAYLSVNSRDVLAFQLLAQGNIGDIPFNQLALLGNESMMRGYYTGRYRDNNLLAFQTEYRFLPLPLRFTDRLGAAVFASAGSVCEYPEKLSTRDFVWSGGAGLRLLLFPKKDIYTRIDAAFTEEGTGFYIFIGEAF